MGQVGTIGTGIAVCHFLFGFSMLICAFFTTEKTMVVDDQGNEYAGQLTDVFRVGYAVGMQGVTTGLMLMIYSGMYLNWFTMGNRRERFAGNILIGMGVGVFVMCLQSAVLYGWQSFEMGEMESSTLIEDCGHATYDGAGSNGEVSKGCWYATRDKMTKNVYETKCPTELNGDCPSFRLFHGDGQWDKSLIPAGSKSKIFSDTLSAALRGNVVFSIFCCFLQAAFMYLLFAHYDEICPEDTNKNYNDMHNSAPSSQYNAPPAHAAGLSHDAPKMGETLSNGGNGDGSAVGASTDPYQ